MPVYLHKEISGDGPTIVIQAPAWGPSSDYLRLTLAPFFDRFRVVTYDSRNTGRSERVERPDAQATEHLVEDLEAVRRDLGVERFSLVGHSHGGFIAMAYAVRHARQLDGLLLLNTSLRRDPPDAGVERILAEMEADPARQEAVQAFRRTGGVLSGIETDVELARCLRVLMPAYFVDLDAMRSLGVAARGARAPSVAALQRVPRKLEAWVADGLPSVRVPALVVTGVRDVATPPPASREICRLLPQAQLQLFERSGHHPWLEEPELFRRVVGRFLDDLEDF